uniref:tRNA (32-2'-O)-methyltransferase regulator THADA n=1 Tax=Capitella teleta TaxID=283909 RepID=X2AWR9_CAPTE
MVVKKKKPVMKEPARIQDTFESLVSGPYQRHQLVKDFLHASTLPIQLALLKKVVSKLSDGNLPVVDIADFTLVLAALYYSAVPKHQIIKAIARSSKNIAPESKERLRKYLSELLSKQIENLSPTTVNNVASLMDNFKIGEESAIENCTKSSYLLDCQAACAMALTLIVKIIHKERTPAVVHSHIFSSDSTTSCTIEEDLQSLSSISPVSTICLLNGMLAMLSPTDLSYAYDDQRSLLVDAIAVCLIKIVNNRLPETNARVMCSKTLVLLANKAWYVAETVDCPEWLLASLHGDALIPQQWISYSWSHWEDPLDVIVVLRHQARSLFDATISCHLTASSQGPKLSPFLLDTTRSILALDWNSKGKYGPLCCLVEHIGATQVLNICPDITHHLFRVIQEQQLACYVSELYDKLLSNHCRELSPEDPKAKEAWLKQWVEPMLHKLCTGCPASVARINEVIVPKFLKKNADSLPFIIAKLSPRMDTDGSVQCNLGALVTFLKQAKSLGILQSIKKDSIDLWNGVVSMETIHLALCHSEDQVRLDALGLLCENLKTTELISPTDLSLLLQSLPHNLRCQAPAFRQHLCALLKRVFIRFRESYISLKRSEKTTDAERYDAFHCGLCDMLFGFLHPGSCFPSRTAALSILALMASLLTGLEKLATPERLQTLVHSIGDSFEQNKIECYSVLLSLPTLNFKVERIQDLVDLSFKLSKSTRPQDCNTAAYLMKFLSHLPQSAKVIDIRAQKLLNVANFDYANRSLRILALLKCLSEDLRQVLQIRNFLVVAAQSPFYCVLHCIRYLLEDISLNDLPELDQWTSLLSDIITMSFDVAAKVAPVVNNSSPEGFIPTGQNAPDDPVDDAEMLSKVNAMPEYLIVCCWRSIKEVSLLLGFLCQAAPISREGHAGVITEKQVRSIGDYFIAQLLESRHRGAFELAYAGFVKMADMLWRCPIETLRALPEQWLHGILTDIKASDCNSKLCATRRSAGVPFYVQALVSTETANTRRQNFLWIIKELLILAKPADGCLVDSQVHAMNILRSLFRDTRLSEDVSPFIADGLQAAILGYGAQDWAVRNSSSLLFSALMVRIFGVNRSRDETAKKNLLTDSILHLHPGLYPVLMVLGRLVPSVMEGPSSSVNLTAFIPHVIKCTSSPVYKTRMMAARAICPLVAKDDITRVLTMLFDIIPSDGIFMHNQLHGILLQVDQILSELEDLPLGMQALICDCVSQRLVQHRRILSKENLCLPTQAVYLQVLTKTLRHSTETQVSSISEALRMTEIITYLSGIITHIEENITHFPGRYDFMEAAADCLVALMDLNSLPEPETLLELLQTDSYEVKLRILRYLSLKLSSSTRDAIQDFLLKSDDCFQILVSIAWNSAENSLCVAEVLDVLNLLPRCQRFPWQPDDAAFKVALKLQTLQKSCRYEVSLAALRLSAQLMPALLTAVQPHEQQVILVDWTQSLSDSISSQQSFPLRFVIAQGLLANANSLLTNKNLPGELQFAVWRCIFRLLQDEDAQVRDVTAHVVASLPVAWLPREPWTGCAQITVQPTVAIESCIVAMVTACRPTMSLTLVDTLCGWILTDLEPDWVNRVQEVRLFDKGELNTYRDELNFASSLIFHLDSLLESLPAGPDLSAVISLQIDHCREIFDDLLPELKKFDLGATFLRDGDFNNLMIKLKRVQKLANVLQRYDVTLKSNVDCLNAALCAFHVVV